MNKKVKIIWNDAKLFSPKDQEVRLTKMETIGLLKQEFNGYIIVQNPTTINLYTKENHPGDKPNFYYIPKVLIQIMEDLE